MATRKATPKNYSSKSTPEKLEQLELELRALLDSGELSPAVELQVSMQLARLALDLEKIKPSEGVTASDPIEALRLRAIG